MSNVFDQGQAMRELFSTNQEKLEDKVTHLDDVQSRNAYDQQHRGEWDSFLSRIRHRKELKAKGKISEPRDFSPEAGLKPIEFAPVQAPKMGIKDTRRKNSALSASKVGSGLSRYYTDYTQYIDVCFAQRREQGKTEWEDEIDYTKQEAIAGEQIWKEWNPDMFEPEFFGKNFEYVSREVDKMNFTMRNFGEGTPGFDTLSVGQKERMRVFAQTVDLVNDCYEKALAKHCLKFNIQGDHNSGITVISGSPGDVDTPLSAAQEALRTHVANQDITLAQRMGRSIQSEFETELSDVRQENVPLQEALKREYPLAKGNFFSMLNYEDVQKYMAALDNPKYLDNVDQNREIIDKMLVDFVNMNEVLCEYQCKAKAYTNLQSRFREQNGTDVSLYSSDDRMYAMVLDRKLDALVSQKEIYSKALEDMALALNHLIMGKQELNDSTYLLLEKYGYATPQEKIDREIRDASLFQQTYEAKHADMIAAIGRAYPNNTDEMVEKYTKGTTGRAIMLIRPGEDAYNDGIIRMLDRMEELKTAKATRTSLEGAGQYTDEKKAEYRQVTSNAWETCSPILEAKLNAILEADLSEFINLTPEQLIANQQRFLDLVMASMMVSDLCKQPSDVEGLSMKEKLLGKPAPSEKRRFGYRKRVREYEKKDAILSAKKNVIEGCRVMARGYALSADGVLKVNDLHTLLSGADLVRYNGTVFSDYTDPAEKMAAYGAYQVEIGKKSYNTGIEGLKQTAPELLKPFAGV